jgi:pyridoxine 5'-phosphate synthase PdxJ
MNSKKYNYLKSILLTCSMMCLLVTSVIAQVSLSVTVRPPYSAQLNDYRHLGNKAIITLVNSSATALQIKLTGSLTNESSGLFISTNNNYRPSAPVTIAPHGSKTITADAGAMNFLDQNNTTTNASDKLKQNIM